MHDRGRTHERLCALFLLGVALLLPPLLLVFNHPVRVLGVPVLYLYVFLAWALIIALAAAVARTIPDEEPGGGPRQGGAAPPGDAPDA